MAATPNSDKIHTAYSYIRFSTPEQMKGDSLRRQTEAAAAWCDRHGVHLDTATTLHDLGRSAFTGSHRKNPDRHALAAFLKLVEQGRVPRGSYLVIENLDRLSREHIRPALTLLLNLIEAGVRVVQLKPVEQVYDEDVEPMALMMAIMELSRGHGESARKSDTNGAKWQEKLACAREGKDQPPRRRDGRVTKAITSRLPAWVHEVEGQLALIPERAAVVKRIFRLAGSGYGLASIVGKLTGEKVPCFGRSGVWVRAYLAKILKDRRALGEHQPRGKGRKPDGPPIANYFPPVVTEEEFNKARAGALERKKRPGRIGQHVNLFSGLLRDARDGDSCIITRQGGGGQRVIINNAGAEGRATYRSFPLATFEAAILSLLSEIDPREVLNGNEATDEVGDLAGRHAAAEASIALIEADLDEHGESPTLFRRLREKEAEKRQLAEQLAQALQKAAQPLSQSWGEAQSLLASLDASPDPHDARLRLRSALRRIIDEVWLLVVARGSARLCAVQAFFAGGEHRRDYLILHRPPKANASARTEGRWHAWSLASVVKGGGPDLRDRESARKLEAILEALDLARLEEMAG
jgi:DNA invertase Pin-like site-specific DNA recombinase